MFSIVFVEVEYMRSEELATSFTFRSLPFKIGQVINFRVGYQFQVTFFLSSAPEKIDIPVNFVDLEGLSLLDLGVVPIDILCYKC